MGMGGIDREIVPHERLVCTELFDQAWYPGEALVTTTLVEQGGRTTLTSTMLYVSQETRDNVLKSGMERGVAASYDRLEKLWAIEQITDGVNTTQVYLFPPPRRPHPAPLCPTT